MEDPTILKDLTSSGVKWFPSPEALVQAPVLSERIASKVADFPVNGGGTIYRSTKQEIIM
jgi:hypothetical protein